MNQILFCKYKKHNKNFILLKFQLIFSLIFFLLFSICFLFSLFERDKKENFSKFIAQKFNLNNLYGTQLHSNTDTVIGIIEIEKIDIKYPIFSYCSPELLKLSPCRFFGPTANKIGNLCIAGHNYNDSTFFSRISELEHNDIIKIYDYLGNEVDYYVYDKYEINYQDISCINQNTNGKREITLVTCTNLGYHNRLVIKAKEKDSNS